MPTTIRILVAEDAPVNQALMGGMLSRLGYACSIVSNGQEALDALAESEFDVVLMDLSMPIMDGLEAARQIVARFPADTRPRIIALTAAATGEERRECEAAGMDDFVAKPYTLATLKAALERVHSKR